MTPKAFLLQYGLDGQYSARNGRRIYIEKGKGVRAVFRGDYVQTCFIDLDTYTAHSRTVGPDPERCETYDERALRKLTVLARLARMKKVKPDTHR